MVMVNQLLVTGFVELSPASPNSPLHQTSTVAEFADDSVTLVPIGLVRDTKVKLFGVVPSSFKPTFLLNSGEYALSRVASMSATRSGTMLVRRMALGWGFLHISSEPSATAWCAAQPSAASLTGA